VAGCPSGGRVPALVEDKNTLSVVMAVASIHLERQRRHAGSAVCNSNGAVEIRNGNSGRKVCPEDQLQRAKSAQEKPKYGIPP
jgi:hypothetical protein